jgi:hypothetical protein
MKYIAILISFSFLFAGCASNTTIKKHYRYHKNNKQGPDFPDIGNMGCFECD